MMVKHVHWWMNYSHGFHYGQTAPLPYLDGLQVVVMADANAAMAAMRTGQLDVAGSITQTLLPSLEAFSLAFVANLVSAAVRLGIVGQTDGQRVTAGLAPLLRSAAARAEAAALDALGSCAFRSDLAALRHETQYSRLFRS